MPQNIIFLRQSTRNKKLFSDSFKDELRLLAMGVIGGEVYKEEKSSRRLERVI